MTAAPAISAKHVGIDRVVVGHINGIARVIGLRLFHRRAADDMRHRVDADIAAHLVGAFANVGDMSRVTSAASHSPNGRPFTFVVTIGPR